MGYHLTESAIQGHPASLFELRRARKRTSAIFPDTPKTHTPGSRLQGLGLRFYSASLGRWLSRDPVWEEAFRATASRDIRGLMKRVPKWDRHGDYLLLWNNPIDKDDLLGLEMQPNGCECHEIPVLQRYCYDEGVSCGIGGQCSTRSFNGSIGFGGGGGIPWAWAQCWCCGQKKVEWHAVGILWWRKYVKVEIQWCDSVNKDVQRYVWGKTIQTECACPAGETCPYLNPFRDWYDTTLNP
jgi:hypothetical protein